MNYHLLIGLFLGSTFLSVSQAVELRDVVVTEDFSELPVVQSFPCSKYIDVISCGSHLILEKSCQDTLTIKKDVLSCKSQRGTFVPFGVIDRKSKIEDETLGGVYGYSVHFTNRVSLKEFKTPNGNTEYQLIVK